MHVGIVTDSTAYLPAELVGGTPVVTVPLAVLVGHDSYVEGVDRPEGELRRVLARAGGATTSRPSPTAFLEAYEALAAQGVREIVSVHLSAALSGTYDAALLAARMAPVPVRVVDSAVMGMALGYAVADAAACVRGGGDAAQAAAVAAATAQAAAVRFCVASLEFLRRGGRIGAASALVGSTLAMKPILELRAGRIEPLEKQRTMGRAMARLTELAGESLRRRPGRATVHHVGARERADQVAAALREQHGEILTGEVLVLEMGLVAAAHLGPGSLGVVTAPPAAAVVR